MIYDQIQKNSKHLESVIATLQKQIASAPDGHLVCCHHGHYYKCYQSDGHTRQYIPKSRRFLAEQLALKTYRTYLLQEAQQEKKAMDSYLHLHQEALPSQNLLLIPAYSDLLSGYFRPLSDELNEWMHASYEHNEKHPENLVHKTLSGHLVRSKSESMIASLLYTNHIPFRYENILTLDGTSIYPDFTIRHPKTGKKFYWEHFGLMDDPSYAKHTASKLQLYISHEIIPTISLITTYETQQSPLTAEVIQKLLDHYFLS